MFLIGPFRTAGREVLSKFQRKEGLVWFTLDKKISFSVWVSLNVSLRIVCECFIWKVIPGSRSEGVGKLDSDGRKSNIR